MHASTLALFVSCLWRLSSALPQAADPTPSLPSNASFSLLYPLNTFTPVVSADYAPHPTGFLLTKGNDTVDPAHPIEVSTPRVNNLVAEACSLSPTNPSTFWYETITHNGISPFISGGASWTVFRNVKNYGAKGDGSTNDAAAITSAMTGMQWAIMNNSIY